MKLAQLLKKHNEFHVSGSLASNFGDAHLCQNNRIYRNIRKATLAAGFKFSSEPNSAYVALPLSQLQSILDTQIIPYVDNVSVLKNLEEKMLQVAVWDDIVDNLKRNFLFHESCHAVARSLAFTEQGCEPILNMLIEESFANTCELVGVVDVEDAAHRIFYDCNSYSALFSEKTQFKRAMDELGAELFLSFIFFGYLQSNFLHEAWNDSDFKSVCEILKCQNLAPQKLKLAKVLTKICFTLDERFKYVTTNFYMRLSGLSVTSEQLISFKHLKKIKESDKYQNYIHRLLHILWA